MFRAEGTTAYLRRETAAQAVALRSGRQTVGSDVRLAGVQGEPLSRTQGGVTEKISGCRVALKIGVMEHCDYTPRTPLLHYSITPLLHYSITPSLHYSITPLLHHSITPLLHH